MRTMGSFGQLLGSFENLLTIDARVDLAFERHLQCCEFKAKEDDRFTYQVQSWSRIFCAQPASIALDRFRNPEAKKAEWVMSLR